MCNHPLQILTGGNCSKN